MEFNLTTVATRNDAAFFNPVKRLAINEGGTSSSKTFSIIQLLILYCNRQPPNKPLIVSVVSESLPHLRKSALRDWFKIMGDRFDRTKWNASELIYNFSPVVVMEFFSADQPGKATGPRRDILFVNEVNNVSKAIFDQLDMRTRRFVFVDFNPVCEFWVHNLQGRPEVEWIHSTYLDAIKYLDKNIIDKIESLKELDPNAWRVYGLGLVGKIEGLVYPFFTIIDQFPTFSSNIEVFGLDFGFSVDPTALVKNWIREKNLYSEELIYQRGMDNNQISVKMQEIGMRKAHDVIIADSSEPKSISEIAGYGWNIIGVEKKPGSVEYGHQRVNQYKQHWIKSSTNCIKEQRNFMYIRDKNGKLTEKTTHYFSHGMDARRYAIQGLGNVTGYNLAAMGTLD